MYMFMWSMYVFIHNLVHVQYMWENVCVCTAHRLTFPIFFDHFLYFIY